MEDESEESGVSIADLWRAAKKRLWVILLAAAVLTSVAVLAYVSYIDPHTADYTMEFTLTYPGSASQKYPDGSLFYFRDIISPEALSEVKESDARFSDIDVISMSQSDDITIEKGESGDETRPAEEGLYILSVKKFYFDDRGEATAFLRALAQRPIKEAKARAKKFDFSLDKGIFDGGVFEDKLSLLMEQKSSILSRYDAWISEYSGEYRVSGKSLKNYRTEASAVISDVLFEELTKELDDYGYVSRELLLVKIAELSEEKEINERKIDEIKAMLEEVRPVTMTIDSSNYEEGLAEVLAKLIERNVEIDRQIAALNIENVETFEARIETVYEKMQDVAKTVSEVASVLYEQESRADFKTTNAVSEGGTSAILVGVGVFVLTALIAGAIVCAVELPKMRARERAAAETQAEKDGKGGGPSDKADQTADKTTEE